jgi:hypothetical protein
MADHDYLIEKPLRWLGVGLKQLLAPIIVIFRRRYYAGVVEFVPAPASHPSYRDAACLPVFPAHAAQAGTCSLARDIYNSADRARDDSEAMARIDGSFLALAVGNMPEGGGCTAPTPHVKLCEGAADLLLIQSKAGRPLSRIDLLRIFLNLSDGSHLTSQHVDVYKVSKVRLHPGRDQIGHMQLSGEELDYRPLEITVQAALARVLR